MSRAYLAGNITGGFVGAVTAGLAGVWLFRREVDRQLGRGWRSREWMVPS